MAKTKTSFKPGHAGGRPKGAKNKSYVDASFWLGKASEVLDSEKEPDKKMSIIKWATELIASRIPLIPSKPEESVANALAVKKAADEFVKTLETETSDASPA
jgi:hypothetical protein